MIPTDALQWVKRSRVRIEMGREGDTVLWTKRSTYKAKVLGGRAAFEQKVEHLLHEFGHFIETEEHRFFKDEYGLKLREVEVLGRMYVEPSTAQPTLREIRVMGIQAVLGIHFGCPYNIRETLAPLVRFMPDWCPTYCHFNLSVAETEHLTLQQRESALFDKVTAEIEKEMQKHTVENLFAEFRRRCQIHDDLIVGKTYDDLC
jgi:hypothetical protein